MPAKHAGAGRKEAMRDLRLIVVTWAAAASLAVPGLADEPKKPEAAPAPEQTGTTSFMKDVAPILVQNCIACHNTRKAESKYNMTTFALLAKGGQQGEEITLIPHKPDESRFVELLLPDGSPRMPYKQDPLPKEKIEVVERWVKEGAKYDGTNPTEDWVALLHKTTPVVVPEVYPVAIPVTALAFSPDGSGIVSSGYHELNLWKLGDASLSRRIRGVPERVYDVAFSPDGKWMATAGGDPGQYGTAKLFIAEPDGGGKPVRELVESNDAIFAVAFSPDSKLVAAAGADRAIRIWEVESGKLIATIEDHADWILDLAFSPDNKRLASASRDKTSKVFDVVKKESLVTFPAHAEAVYTVAFTPDGKFVTTGGADNQIRVWNPDEEAKQTAAMGGFGGAVFRLAYHPDGKHLVATGADKIVRVFANNAQVRAFPPHNDWVYSLAVSPDGKTVAAGSWDGEVRLNNFADGAAIKTILAAPGYKPAAPVQAAAK
jgi:dipeptidyl aminopeptidase/acylaminoacyl peptidase